MDSFRIVGGKPLRGMVEAGGSKNCALPVLFATLLSDSEHIVSGVPKLRDMDSTLSMLLHLGATVDLKHAGTFGSDWVIRTSKVKDTEAPYDLVRKMRASVLVLGPLLARFGHARVSLPGGCAIGARPIDLHLLAFEKLGAQIEIKQGYVETRVTGANKRLKGAVIDFPKVSVGATENAMMAACLAEGETILNNAACEPEVKDLGRALQTMGADIEGLGTPTITIRGVRNLGSLNFQIPGDRIEAATYLIAGFLTRGEVEVGGVNKEDLGFCFDALKKAGAEILFPGLKRVICRPKSDQILPVDIVTAPFPGFATDLQAQWMALMCHAQGNSKISETIFENRFMHVPELHRMGADLTIRGSEVFIKGRPQCLQGAPVMATDLRASACLVLAGLAAKGETQVNRIYHLDRGYESMEVKLRTLGADVERLSGG